MVPVAEPPPVFLRQFNFDYMEWKSIKDGKPDNDREVLLAIRGTDIPIQAYYSHTQEAWYGSFEVRDHMQAGRVDNPTLFCSDEITHWMELPKMPELLKAPATETEQEQVPGEETEG